MVVIVISMLLSTTSCSKCREDSSGDRSYDVGDNEFTRSKTYTIWLFLCITHAP